MAVADQALIKRVMTGLLEVVEGARKRDAQNKIDEMLAKMETGGLTSGTSTRLVQLCKAVEAGDFATANKLRVDLSTQDWEHNKNWVTVIRSLLPK